MTRGRLTNANAPEPTTSDPLRMEPHDMAALLRKPKKASPDIERFILTWDDASTPGEKEAWAGEAAVMLRALHERAENLSYMLNK